jgi:hypothetical protein
VFVVPNTFASALFAVVHTPVSQTPVSNDGCPVASYLLPRAPERKTVEDSSDAWRERTSQRVLLRKYSKSGASTSWNKVFGVVLLLTERFGKRGYSSNDSRDHEYKGYNGPNNTPTLRRASILLGKNAGVGGIYFAKDEIVALSKDCG